MNVIAQQGTLIEETTIEFRITVVLEPGDDVYELEDYLSDHVCKFFGATKCGPGTDCPRMWISGHSIVTDDVD